MMNRYSSTPDMKRFDGKRVRLTTTYPPIPISDTDIYIIATDADYLDSLAQKYYQDSTLWWIIARANNIAGTLKVPSGSQLRIPINTQSILSKFFVANQ